ncbi:MAG: hypothetical protein WCV00_20910 [Verrucomicrobiia bacterium]
MKTISRNLLLMLVGISSLFVGCAFIDGTPTPVILDANSPERMHEDEIKRQQELDELTWLTEQKRAEKR